MTRKRSKSRRSEQQLRPNEYSGENRSVIDERRPSKSFLGALFAIDVRSLAAFRIAASFAILVDLAVRSADLTAMYTDGGMFSRTVVCRHYTSLAYWSFHFGSGAWWYQAALFALAAVFAGALLVGFETRWAAIASWLMMVSLHNRVPMLLSGADNLHRLLLFWGMFLPLGSVWSVDAWLARRRGALPRNVQAVLSVASAAILLQMAFTYLFSAMFKTNSNWMTGKAIAETLPHSFYGKPFAVGLTKFPRALSFLTLSVFVVEWICPFLLFSPIRTSKVRLWVVGLLASMHVGIALILNVGLFSLVSLSGLLLFLPTMLWDKLGFPAGGSADDVRGAEKPAKTTRVQTPSPLRHAGQAICALALVYVVFVNLNGAPHRFSLWSPAPKNEVLTIACGLGQKWNMFSESPSRDGWYVGRAVLADGTHIDLLRDGAPATWQRPDDPAADYPNHRWQKLFREMSYTDEIGFQVFRRPVAEYLCRRWNRNHSSEKQITSFALVFCMTSKNEPRLSSIPPIVRETLLHLDLTDHNNDH